MRRFVLAAAALLLMAESAAALDLVQARKIYRQREFITTSDWNGDILYNIQLHNDYRTLLPTVGGLQALRLPLGILHELRPLYTTGQQAHEILLSQDALLRVQRRIHADTVQASVYVGLPAGTEVPDVPDAPDPWPRPSGTCCACPRPATPDGASSSSPTGTFRPASPATASCRPA